MRRIILSLLALFVAVVLLLSTPAPANADEGCVITVAGLKVCGELLGEPLPEVITVTVTPDPIVIPGPEATVTIRPPTETETVTVPGPTTTVTETETSEPEIVGPTPDAVPSTPGETVTVSPSETDTGQAGSSDGTIEADDTDRYDIDFGNGETNIVEVGIGILTLLALVGLLLCALYAGYILGYKDKERKDTQFMRAILDATKARRH